VFSPLVGRLSDFWGRKTFIATGLFLYWLISLGYLLCNSVGDLVLVRIVQGCSGAMIIPLAMAHIGDIAPEKQEGQYLGSFSVSLFAGFGFGPLLGGLIMYRFGIEANFYLMSLLCFLAFLVVILFLPNMKRDKRHRFPATDCLQPLLHEHCPNRYRYIREYSAGIYTPDPLWSVGGSLEPSEARPGGQLRIFPVDVFSANLSGVLASPLCKPGHGGERGACDTGRLGYSCR
jgi:MFS family permease